MTRAEIEIGGLARRRTLAAIDKLGPYLAAAAHAAAASALARLAPGGEVIVVDFTARRRAT